MEPEIVTVRATVIRREEGGQVLTVKLEDGFGHAECIVHADNVAKI